MGDGYHPRQHKTSPSATADSICSYQNAIDSFDHYIIAVLRPMLGKLPPRMRWSNAVLTSFKPLFGGELLCNLKVPSSVRKGLHLPRSIYSEKVISFSARLMCAVKWLDVDFLTSMTSIYGGKLALTCAKIRGTRIYFVNLIR